MKYFQLTENYLRIMNDYRMGRINQVEDLRVSKKSLEKIF
jgi:hypothetical protein